MSRLRLVNMSEYRQKDAEEHEHETDHDGSCAHHSSLDIDPSELVAIYDIKIQDEYSNTLDYKLTPVLLSKCFHTRASNSSTSLLPYSSASCSTSSSSCISANSSASSFEQPSRADAPFVESFHMPLSLDSASQSDFSALRVDYKPRGKMITVNVSMMW